MNHSLPDRKIENEGNWDIGKRIYGYELLIGVVSTKIGNIITNNFSELLSFDKAGSNRRVYRRARKTKLDINILKRTKAPLGICGKSPLRTRA